MMLALVPLMIFADFSYSLDLLSFDPLHQEYTADRDRAGMDFQWVYVDEFPEGVYQNGTFFKFGKPFSGDMWNVDGFDEMPWMGMIHLGETLSLFRNNFEFDHWLSPISFDFAFQGSMILGMEGGMADMIGYDGVFFYGGSMRIADKVSMRLGLHHYCTHFGDGTIKLLGLEKGHYSGQFQTNKKYIRMEAMAVGLSVEPIDGIRLYAEYNFLPKALLEYFDQEILAPKWKEQNYHCQNKPDSYKAQIVNFGVELSYPIFKKLGKTTLSYDCHAYEEGKIVYKADDLAAYPDYDSSKYKAYYDGNRPWEFEHELVLSQEVSNTISIEIGYHNGRFPLNSFYFHRCNYGYVGIRFNPQDTVTIVDTAK